MPRILFLLGVITVTAFGADRPNILFIAVDDLKPAINSFGDKFAKTPNLDRLAARGMRFERAYCNQAVCAPSRNALLAGVRPTTMGIYDLGTNFRKAIPDAVTLPQFFKQNGYRSEGIGKIFHVGHGNVEDPASWSVPFKNAHVIAYATRRDKDGEITREEALFANDFKKPIGQLPRGAAYENPDVPDEAYPDGQLAQEAIQRLRYAKQNPQTNFFLAVGFVKPHLPFCAPKKYWDLYDPTKIELPTLRKAPEGAPAYAPQYGGELRQYDGVPTTGALDENLRRTLIHGYYAAISYMDTQLGKVLDELDRLGLAQNTIIVLWGDHGYHLGDHGMWNKHTNYEQATRIPIIIAAPGVTKAGTKSEALVESVDLYPTLTELAGLKSATPQKLEGTSLVPLLRDGANAQKKEAIFHAYPRNPREKGALIGRAVRTERYRLVEWKVPNATPESADLELYDYQTDPGETKNHASENQETVTKLRSLLATQGEAKPQIQK